MRHLVAVAWPYANGPLHLGHVAGSLLPPDVFARFLRLTGEDAIMVSGSDMHGTPITVAAEKAGVAPEEFARQNHALHQEALAALGIRFDLFTSTATENHRRVVHDLFLTLLANGHIAKRTMTAPFDPTAQRFLPDRYVEGTCPNCGAKDARGDQCDACGRTLDPQDLKDPRSKLTGATPVWRETEHFFLLLSKLEPDLRAWVAAQADRAAWRPTVRNFTENWLKEGLKDRAITRDMTYGVPIPAEAGAYPDKRIYVWFEAVTGYLSAPQELRKDWEPYWRETAGPRGWYFLGKDNIPFHTIVWPAMLLAYNKSQPPEKRLALPWDVPANEFLQFAGAKFSKSRGNAFYVLDLLKTFSPDQARYYLGVNMPEKGDTDWTWEDFVAKVNDELVGTLGNYVNRVLSIVRKDFDGRTPGVARAAGGDLEKAALDGFARARADLEAREFKKGLRDLMTVAQAGNKAVDTLAPWKLLKEGRRDEAGAALLVHLDVIKALATALAPYLPHFADEVWRQLGEPGPSPRARSERVHAGEDDWPRAGADGRLATRVAAGQRLGEVRPIVQKLDPKEVLTMFTDESKAEARADRPPQPQPEPRPQKATVTIDDFGKLDLRVGVVTSVEDHPKADKLYVLKVDLGDETRQIVAGLREKVPRDELLGRRVVVIANLAPAKLRGVESQGMLLAAEDAAGNVAPLTPASDVASGSRIR